MDSLLRLPTATRLGGVRLQVANLERSLDYYVNTLGLRLISQDGQDAVLGANGRDEPLVTLHERPGANPSPKRGRLGLYHFAILLPTRSDLGRFIERMRELNVRLGSSDHLVSEALYLTDPDGLGIEIYADRPRSEWKRSGPELAMAADPLDFASLQRAAGDTRWSGMPAGTVMGHVHLHVGSLAAAEEFFGKALGMDVTARSYPGALFLSAGGYHHHLGTNIWAGPDAAWPTDADARLLEWRVVVPEASDVAAVANSMERSGQSVRRDSDGWTISDPWGTTLRLSSTGGQ